MWCNRVHCTLALLSIALAVLNGGAASTADRYREILETSMDQDLLKDTMIQLLHVVADADKDVVEVDDSKVEIPPDNEIPMKFQHRQQGTRMRKNCKNFFWKSYALC
ncbi:somatostatin-1A-like [Chiloscyllium plagiosum]|uniref:somatostatin-1A-like n=1 Tax=Chiloscyllium plagiosum TaxID=36176 RepID=UPI001CB81002|nr:somatostatin-1A-like [Chiloscyllium plagiosum]